MRRPQRREKEQRTDKRGFLLLLSLRYASEKGGFSFCCLRYASECRVVGRYVPRLGFPKIPTYPCEKLGIPTVF